MLVMPPSGSQNLHVASHDADQRLLQSVIHGDPENECRFDETARLVMAMLLGPKFGGLDIESVKLYPLSRRGSAVGDVSKELVSIWSLVAAWGSPHGEPAKSSIVAFKATELMSNYGGTVFFFSPSEHAAVMLDGVVTILPSLEVKMNLQSKARALKTILSTVTWAAIRQMETETVAKGLSK